MIKSNNPIKTVTIECQECGARETIKRHTSGRKRVYCRVCIAKHKRKYDREMQRQARIFKLKSKLPKGAF